MWSLSVQDTSWHQLQFLPPEERPCPPAPSLAPPPAVEQQGQGQRSVASRFFLLVRTEFGSSQTNITVIWLQDCGHIARNKAWRTGTSLSGLCYEAFLAGKAALRHLLRCWWYGRPIISAWRLLQEWKGWHRTPAPPAGRRLGKVLESTQVQQGEALQAVRSPSSLYSCLLRMAIILAAKSYNLACYEGS